MNIESWRITKPGQCLDSLLDIMLVRRATDNVDGGSYDATWLQPFLSRQPSFHFEFPTLSAVQRFESRRHLSVGMICKCVQINYEVTDHCTRQICQAMGRVPGKHGSRKYQERKLMWARVMSRCSGRAFLQLAADEGLHGASIPAVLGDAWDRLSAQTKGLMDPGDFFSPHFEPQDCYHNQVRLLTKEQFLDPAILSSQFHLPLHPARLQLRNFENRYREKRAIMIDIKEESGAGAFVAKHFWRVLHRFGPSQVPSDMTYSETGSGCRTFLLLYFGVPQGFSVTCRSQTAADAFNKYLQDFIVDLRNALNRRIRLASSSEETKWLNVLKSELLSAPEAVQFFCCECFTILRFMTKRSKRYLRQGVYIDDVNGASDDDSE